MPKANQGSPSTWQRLHPSPTCPGRPRTSRVTSFPPPEAELGVLSSIHPTRLPTGAPLNLALSAAPGWHGHPMLRTPGTSLPGATVGNIGSLNPRASCSPPSVLLNSFIGTQLPRSCMQGLWLLSATAAELRGYNRGDMAHNTRNTQSGPFQDTSYDPCSVRSRLWGKSIVCVKWERVEAASL